jgi:hypothetical protein
MMCASTELLLVIRQMWFTDFVMFLIAGQCCRETKIEEGLMRGVEAKDGDSRGLCQGAWLGANGGKNLLMFSTFALASFAASICFWSVNLRVCRVYV